MPQEGEPVVEKRVNSCFIGTDLEEKLQREGIRSLAICGLTTDHCVSTTARMAGNLGFATYVISDACATFDRQGPDGKVFPAEEVHEVALASLHGEFATVMSSSEVSGWVRQEAGAVRSSFLSVVDELVASDAPDEEVLEEVMRIVHNAHPLWDWSGIYLLVEDTLVVGPFAGSEEVPEHSRIEIGEGVCGMAVAEDENQTVRDVRELDNYLACSLSTRSELVVLIRHEERVVGQFDIDSDRVGAFSADDEAFLEELAGLIAPRVASLAEARSAGR